jgi:hypothetical protein
MISNLTSPIWLIEQIEMEDQTYLNLLGYQNSLSCSSATRPFRLMLLMPPRCQPRLLLTREQFHYLIIPLQTC